MSLLLLPLSDLAGILVGCCVLAVPLLLGIVAFCSFRGFGKWYALAACLVMLPIYLMELVSNFQQGNLTGMITFVVDPPILFSLLVANTIQGLIEWRRARGAQQRTDVA